jgi:hypothetical protein
MGNETTNMTDEQLAEAKVEHAKLLAVDSGDRIPEYKVRAQAAIDEIEREQAERVHLREEMAGACYLCDAIGSHLEGCPEDISPEELQHQLDSAVEHAREERANPTYDESTNPSNGWRAPEVN